MNVIGKFARRSLRKDFIYSARNQFATSTFASVDDRLKLKFHVYLENDKKKQFIVSQKDTLADIENLLKSGDESIKIVNFFFNKEKLTNLNLPYGDFALNNNLVLEINKRPAPYDLEIDTSFGYYRNTKFDGLLSRKEVSLADADVICNFIKVLQENLEKQNQSKAMSFSPEQLKQAVDTTINNFSEKNDSLLKKTENIGIQLSEQLEEEEKNVASIEDKSKNKAKNVLKFLIGATSVQWVVLFYLTYVKYGWDFSEPISWLISFGLETIGLAYYIKKYDDLGQEAIFQKYFEKSGRKHLLAHRTLHRDSLSKRVNFLKKRIFFAKLKI